MHLKAVVVSILLFWVASSLAEGIPDFRQVDTTTYGLYSRQQWAELVEAGNEYLRYGYDYYYLRMRLGIAWYEMENYLKSVTHFNRALTFNSGDTLAYIYLYYAYLELNWQDAANRILGFLPESIAGRLTINRLDPLERIYLETGPLISSGKAVNSNLNLDGDDDVYGDIQLIRDSWYSGLGMFIRVRPCLRMQVSYMNLFQGRTTQVMSGDSLLFDRDLPVKQHQFYLSPTFRFGKGFSLSPAFHYLDITWRRITSSYDIESKRFVFDEDTIRQQDYVVSVHLARSVSLFKLSLTGAYANLNELDRYQAEFALTYYPQGNLDLYAHSVIRYVRGREDHLLFSETAGLKIVKGWWLEASATFGQTEEFFENNGYIVYNLPEDLLFKWGAQTCYQINDRLMVSLKYENLYRESRFLQYVDNSEVSGEYIPEYKPYTYHQHLIIGSLTWRL